MVGSTPKNGRVAELMVERGEDVVGNKDLSPVFPSYWCPGGGKFTVRAPTAATVEFRFDEPNGIFLELMAFRGISMYFPKHYLKQFHERYVPKEKLEAAWWLVKFLSSVEGGMVMNEHDAQRERGQGRLYMQINSIPVFHLLRVS